MSQEQHRRTAPTIAENIQAKSRTLNNWHKANPGLSWESPEYPEKEPNINIPRAMLNSQAYRSLSRAALLVYQDFLAKRIMRPVKRETQRGGKEKIWVIVNNGEIVYPFSEAESKGFSRQTYNRAIVELQDKGFIDIKHRGKGGRPPAKGTGDMTKYWVDNRWRDYGTADFWKPRNPKTKDTRQGRGFAILMNDPVKKKAILKKRKQKNSVSGVKNHTRISLTSVNNHTS